MTLRRGKWRSKGKAPCCAYFARYGNAERSIPSDTGDDLPTDLAKNKKHYLYGHPKEEE